MDGDITAGDMQYVIATFIPSRTFLLCVCVCVGGGGGGAKLFAYQLTLKMTLLDDSHNYIMGWYILVVIVGYRLVDEKLRRANLHSK